MSEKALEKYDYLIAEASLEEDFKNMESEERDNYDRNDFWRKETLEEELKEAIDWLQEELKEYKKKFG